MISRPVAFCPAEVVAPHKKNISLRVFIRQILGGVCISWRITNKKPPANRGLNLSNPKLTFGELETSSRFGLARFLSFDHSGVSGKESGLFHGFFIVFAEYSE